MSYNANAKYNTRNSGRYNSGGQFVSGGELIPGANPPRPAPAQRPPPQSSANFGSSNLQQQQQQQQQQNTYAQRNQNLQMIQTQDVEMKVEPKMDTSMGEAAGAGDDTSNGGRPHWMKPKLYGVKKVSNKERRRRQNETLRRLLTPKNALMVLNEMMPGEQLASQFKVEAAQTVTPHQYYNKVGQHSFCADLTLDGNTYKGYGENKMTARNAAAEQAIRDLIIKKMFKFISDGGAAAAAAAGGEEGGAGVAAAAAAVAGPGAEGEADGEDAEGEALPMIQLASYALHKLFSEWEYEGHKVPQLKPTANTASESESNAAPTPTPPKPRAPKANVVKQPRTELPAGAATMHPCMLLTYMRPQLVYRELGAGGDRPSNMFFTFGVDVDGATYLGKATNKKEARKMAARAACQALFNVRFDEPTMVQ